MQVEDSYTVKMFGTKLQRNKKGSLQDIILMGIVLLFFSITVLVGLKIASEFRDNMNNSGTFDGSDAVVHVGDTVTKYTRAIDNMFLFLVFFMGIVTLILAALIRVHPIFIPLFFIGLVMTIFLAAVFANVYQSVSANAQLAGITATLPFMNNIMLILPVIVGIFGLIMMFVLYKLWSIQQ